MPDQPPESKPSPRLKQRAERLIKRYDALKSERGPWETQWQELAEHFCPRKAAIQRQRGTPDNSLEARIFDTTAVDSLRTMAAGLLSWTTPASEPWFQYDPALRLKGSDRTKSWLQDCTHLMQEYLAGSNYYTERQENLHNKCGFGTSALLGELRGDRLRFEAQAIGSYVIEEDSDGMVTSIYREQTFTATQAVEKFGAENLSEEIQKAQKKEKDSGEKFPFVFIHAIYPREAEDIPDTANRDAAIFMPYASCYVDHKAKMIVRESGFPVFPAMVARYEKWDTLGLRSPWGYSPAFSALPDAKQANFLAAQMDVGVERGIQPPMIVGSGLEGQLVMTAGGITYVAAGTDPGQYPRELYKPMDIRSGMEWLKTKQDAIKTKFHVEFFNLFASIDRQMTAREVNERAGERLTLISPAFSRDVTEECDPLLRLVFALCGEANMLPPPPPEAIEARRGQMVTVPDPKVTFTSRMALAIKELRGVAADRMVDWLGAVGQVKPQVWDNINIDSLARNKALGLGMDSSLLIDEDQRDAGRQAQAKAMVQQQEAAMLTEAAKAAGGGQGIKALMEGPKQ